MFENDSKFSFAEPDACGASNGRPEPLLPVAPLARLRLLVALDALLATGSVSGAAKALGISPPAASRMLAQLRRLFDDELLVRSGRGMVPTALAGRLRMRVRGLAAEADALMRGEPAPADPPPPHPPLALERGARLDGQPDECGRLRRLFEIGPTHPPQHRLARHVAMVGAGRSRARPLDLAEAEDAFAILLDGEADPVQVGALLVALQYRGITPDELAGLVRAARRQLRPLTEAGPVDLDWPAYLSPRNRRTPWFLPAARLLGEAGHRVLLHGFGSQLSPLDPVLEALGIPVAGSVAEAEARLSGPGCVFLPLPAILPQLQALVNLYRVLQMRSPVNLSLQLLNPLAAPATVMGLPGASLATLHREAAGLLGWNRLLCIDSHRDVAQATPHRLMGLALSERAEVSWLSAPARLAERCASPPPGLTSAEHCRAVWNGQSRDPAAIAAIVDTAALGLLATGAAPYDLAEARRLARDLWDRRTIAGPRADTGAARAVQGRRPRACRGTA